ncbi:hypothetical protein KP509_37G046500 [Ceratopteris richardii]|uniref:Uncharacterized protein n=1 Tax=Ceratopteris richardii TaxID=49495 RepID=A0A8T2Q8M0_CERRI|nr:hypothetical protein KP509_37G046500 [Ceratopteris richardii]
MLFGLCIPSNSLPTDVASTIATIPSTTALCLNPPGKPLSAAMNICPDPSTSTAAMMTTTPYSNHPLTTLMVPLSSPVFAAIPLPRAASTWWILLLRQPSNSTPLMLPSVQRPALLHLLTLPPLMVVAHHEPYPATN